MSIFGAPQRPLPRNAFIPTSNEFLAYEMCLKIELNFDWGIDSDDDVFLIPPRDAGRVLGFGLLYAPTETGRQNLATEINDCAYSKELIAALAHVYIHGLIRIFYNPDGLTLPNPGSQSPREPDEETAVTFEELLTELGGQPAQLKDLLLERDNRRCVFSGKLDSESVLRRRISSSPGDQFSFTRVVPIIMQLDATNVSGTIEAAHSKFVWAATTTTIIHHLGGLDIQALLGEKFLYNPLNTFTGGIGELYRFNNLQIWLEETKDTRGQIIPNTYDQKYYGGDEWIVRLGLKPQVTLHEIVKAGVTIPSPHPQLLKLHAACARVGRMSGAVKFLEYLFAGTDNFTGADDALLTLGPENMAVNPGGAEELVRAPVREKLLMPSHHVLT